MTTTGALLWMATRFVFFFDRHPLSPDSPHKECYHCQVGHPGFAKLLDCMLASLLFSYLRLSPLPVPNYNVMPFQNFARHVAPLKSSVQQDAFSSTQPPVSADWHILETHSSDDMQSFTFTFPAVGCTTSAQMFYIMRSRSTFS